MSSPSIDKEAVSRFIGVLLTGLSFSLTAFLWLVFAAVLVRHGYFRQTPFPAAAMYELAVLLGGTAYCAHFAASLRAAWYSFPYWCDGEISRRRQFRVSLPSLLTGVLLLVAFFFRPAVFPVVCCVLLFEIAAWLTFSKGEQLARNFHEWIDESEEDVPAPVQRAFSPAEAEPLSTIPFTGGDEEEEEMEEEEVPPSEDLLFSQTRVQCPGGRERVEGWFRVHFAAGESSAVVHLSFCPPLKGVPAVQFVQIEGEEVRITPTLTEPFGVRVEIKRNGSEYPESKSVRVCFFADEKE